MMKATPARWVSITPRATLLLVLGLAIFASPARADRTITLTLTAGQAYEIRNIDADSMPVVSFTENSNSFTVKSSGPHALTVFSFQPGKGTVEAKIAGEDVTYRVIVSGITHPEHPLRAGTAPPPVNGVVDKVPPPAPYAPPSSAAPAAPETAAHGGISGGGYSAAPGTTRTEVIGPAAPNVYAVAGGNTGGSGPAAARSSIAATMLSPNVGMSTAEQWHEQPRSITSQQFTTNPRSFHSEGYLNNRAFGGRHNLPPDAITITSGTSQVYDFGGPISRVAIANSRVADVQVLGNHQLMLVGHEPGFSSLVVWDSDGNYVERQIWAEIAGHQEVMLHAIVAEVDLQKLEQMGVDISVALTKYGFTWVGLPGLVATPFTASNISTGPTSMVQGGVPLPLLFSQNMTYGVGGSNSNVSAFAFFQFIENHDLGRILARPQLLANSGERAKFLSGGEIPIVITQALTSTIVFKQYGTSVSFVPTVIGSKDIDLLVRPEVSKPDYTQAVQLFGFNVPAFVTRRAETRVRLRNNQTLIIAGLILDDSRSTVHKVPYLGDVPYLGSLFRQTYWSHSKSELVMSVTPEIVRPLPPGGEVALPTERQGPLTPQEVKTRPLRTQDAARPRF